MMLKEEKTMEKWEDVSIISENQLPAHATLKQENVFDLNGEWKFRCVLDPDKADRDFYSLSYDDTAWDSLKVPTCWQTKGYSAPYYFGAGFPPAINMKKSRIPSIDHTKTYCGLYRKVIDLDASFLKGQAILRFDSIKSAFYLYVNSSYVGMSKGSMLPCEFDVSNLLKEGENLIAVKVFEYSDATYIEDQDMWFFAGIYRDVTLYQRNEKHIEDIYLHSSLTSDYKDAVLYCDVRTSLDRCSIDLKIAGQHISKQLDSCDGQLQLPLKDVRLWSAEDPYLYDVEVSLYEEGVCIETKTLRFGFREDKVDHEKALYLHNGKPIKLRGINYHSFTPEDGYYVPEEVYKKDLLLMKKANINAIRTSHYPQADIFYDLCDEMGFYVMDECNVESHGVREKGVPGDDETWRKHVVDRMERMVKRDRNHACVSIWSLGNESHIYKNHFEMKMAALALDQSRPIHYEGGRNLEVSDFLCDGYSSTERETKFANKEDVKDKPTILQRLMPLFMSLGSISYEEYKHHPIVLTEYNYCMGNSGSDVAEHVKIMDACDQYCGGFVWDFKDKSLRKGDMLTYGGDFGVRDQKGNVCCDGMCDPYSVPHSVYDEIAHAFSPILIDLKGKDTIEVCNRNFFISTETYMSYYKVMKDGVCIFEKKLETDVGPRQTGQYELELPEMNEDGVYQLNVFFEHDAGTSYAQFLLKERAAKEKVYGGNIKQEDGQILLSCADTVYSIDTKTGDLAQIIFNNEQLLSKPLRPSFYRPYTDGDVGFIGIAMGRYRKADIFAKYSFDGLKVQPVIQISDKKITVTDKTKEFILVRTYTIVNDKLHVDASVTFTGKKAANRFGLQMEVDKSFDTMDYFGKGPYDHYPGKDESGLVSLYSQDIGDQDEYVRPQEHGNRTHVRYADIHNDKLSLHIEKDEEDLNVSFWPYTLKDLHEADHICDLPEHEVTCINIDCIQNGLSDCFVACDEKYLIKPGHTYSYSFYLNVKAL